MEKIRHKYYVGDKVIIPADKMIITTCPFCEGEGSRMVNNELCYCQNCEDGKIKIRSSEIVHVEGVVKGMHISVSTEDEYDEASYKNDDGTFVTVEYYVGDTPDDVWDYGTYREQSIKKESE